ncbi:glycerol kinase [Aestuariivirga litoralis]|uniref:ATP:glycerol 3-phosphotransferase n=1 Tax=Aestuariivirga litoralis TaxID=2650924 RepID=A0A2W2BK23_9HYPH|nr:FGGY family carbohydrate kinase [Aestuariivirga litoralis]PZF76549.1 glycerol kinase [Aestuariivirga litoralis]
MKVVAVDQGTTGTKSYVYDADGRFTSVAGFEHAQVYPQPGWVEHDPDELLRHVTEAIAAAGEVDAIGIDNQGETVIAWDSATGRPIHNAIVWQDDRTKDVTARLKAEGAEELTQRVAGLPLDPYFSAAKLRWFIDHVPEAKQLLKEKRLRLGTSEAFFLARLTGHFVTDVTNASRTSLMSLDSFQWDSQLCDLFGVPVECLPEIRPSTGPFGEHRGVPVTASFVDQQAALFGHGCSGLGDVKITFGTGAFALAIAGAERLNGSRFGIVPTVAWQQMRDRPHFALEGGVYNAASAVNWARQLGLFSDLAEINAFDKPPAILRDLAFVPALSGLACPHWDRAASGMWIGLGLDTTRADLMQSLIEGVALRAAEVIAAMAELLPLSATVSVDGGMARNPYLLQVLADVTGRTIVVPSSTDLTALGTARMAMRGLGAARLPDMPPPASSVKPVGTYGPQARSRFATAITRARGWKEA